MSEELLFSLNPLAYERSCCLYLRSKPWSVLKPKHMSDNKSFLKMWKHRLLLLLFLNKNNSNLGNLKIFLIRVELYLFRFISVNYYYSITRVPMIYSGLAYWLFYRFTPSSSNLAKPLWCVCSLNSLKYILKIQVFSVRSLNSLERLSLRFSGDWRRINNFNFFRYP